MRIVFFGTPEFAVPSLRATLEAGMTVVSVVTQPDRPRGRSRSTLSPSPVKAEALARGLPVLQPERPSEPGFVAALEALGPDLGVVVAYGHLIKPGVLAIPPLGMINVHASLLPAWRGAGPIQAAIAHGDSETGVSIMRMEAGLDSGPVLLRQATPIGPTETAGQLTARLAELGAVALGTALGILRDGGGVFLPQDPALVSLAPKVTRQSARIDWSQNARLVSCHLRAHDPASGAWTTCDSADLKLFTPETLGISAPPGTIIATEPQLIVAAGSGAVVVGEVQPSGRPRMTAADWIRGRGANRPSRFE